ncbi:hypothetical protein G6F65_016665 [Rhizopus arrhizus]|nr:hypothetical protein G6F65_016665 [Rhizopus arrhizus]
MLCPLRFSQNRSANSLICRRTPPHGSPGAATIPGAHPSACVRLRGDRCRGVRAVRQPVSAGRGPPAGHGPGLGRAQCRLVLPAGDALVPGIRGRRGAVQLSVLGRHAVRRGHQHHPVLLLRFRTADPLPATAAGRPRSGRGRCTPGHAAAVPALGPAWLGRVRVGRDGDGVFRVPPQPAAGTAFGAVPADRQAHQRPDRLHRGRAGHRRHRVRHRRRHGLRRTAPQCRPVAPVQHPALQPGADHPGGQHDGRSGGRGCLRRGEGRALDGQHQHAAGDRAGAVHAVRRPHAIPAQHLDAEPG